MKIILNNIKKLAALALIIVLQQIITSSKLKTSGTHPGSTGAPNELTCARSGCHSDLAVNPGDLVNTLVFNNGDSTYVPGATYTLTVKAEQPGISKFGFQLVALKSSDNSNKGTFSLTDATRTRVINGENPNTSRRYVTHTTNGTIPVAVGVGEWSFNWTAPATAVGPITFYYATNATNNNNSSTGDQIYLSSFQINQSTSIGIKEVDNKESFNAFYSATTRQLLISCDRMSAVSNKAKIEIRDMSGKLIQVNELNSTIPVKDKAISLNESIANGIYLVTYRVDNTMLSRKIYIEG